MLNKRYVAEFKALGAEDGATEPGTFEALVAVFDNVDSQGDRIKSGAFDDTLEAWRKSGDPIPIVLAHEWNDPWAHIGYADPKDIKAIPGRGLLVKKGVLDIEDNPVAAQVYRLMKRRSLKEFSFGYTVADGGEKRAADGAYDLTKVNLLELGPCLKGANDSTELLAVKSALSERSGRDATLEERMAAIEERLGLKAVYAPVDLEGTFEETQADLREACAAAYPHADYVEIVATYADSVVFKVGSFDGGASEMYRSSWAQGEDGIELGEAEEVHLEASIEPGEKEGEIETPEGETTEVEETEEVEVETEAETTEEEATVDIERLLSRQALDFFEAFTGDSTGAIEQADAVRRLERFEAELSQ